MQKSFITLITYKKELHIVFLTKNIFFFCKKWCSLLEVHTISKRTNKLTIIIILITVKL